MPAAFLGSSKSIVADLRSVKETAQRFMAIEAAGGLVMLAATLAAVGFANSPWHAGFGHVWTHHAGLELGRVVRLGDLTVKQWINDGALALFFLVVGLEIKREFVRGELRDRKAALLPIVAAVGGMVVPALIYIAMNRHAPASKAWGVTVATDIAFAAGVVLLAGDRVPSSARVFILTLAVVDDLLGMLVVVAFYGASLKPAWIALALAAVLLTVACRRYGVSSLVPYIVMGVITWYGLKKGGIEPALTGVIFGLLTPATAMRPGADPPLDRLEDLLARWVSFLILPLFALANAGVRFVGSHLDSGVVGGIIVSRVVGKPLGVWLFAFLALRIGVAKAPPGLTMRTIVSVGTAAGMGFVVAIFIGELAFPQAALVESAKAGVLGAAAIAGGLSYTMLRYWRPR